VMVTRERSKVIGRERGSLSSVCSSIEKIGESFMFKSPVIFSRVPVHEKTRRIFAIVSPHSPCTRAE
jgi:hypothetical protein